MAETKLSIIASSQSGCEIEDELGGVSSGSEGYETPDEGFETKGIIIIMETSKVGRGGGGGGG